MRPTSCEFDMLASQRLTLCSECQWLTFVSPYHIPGGLSVLCPFNPFNYPRRYGLLCPHFTDEVAEAKITQSHSTTGLYRLVAAGRCGGTG